jgi:hypothetical protein
MQQARRNGITQGAGGWLLRPNFGVSMKQRRVHKRDASVDMKSRKDPEWLQQIEDLANEQLGTGSSCEQVHPIIARWFDQLVESEPPESRDSVVQAISCLATEILYSSPDNVLEVLDQADEDDVALWIEQIVLIGRAFEIALRKGDLDDL